VCFELNGRAVSVPDGGSLLDALREHLGVRSVKDGCSPQGQCGCCTVWVDSSPRVACVTPLRRVAGRHVTTLEGLDEEVRTRWATAFLACGASQCGFCTPGIVMRLAGLEARGGTLDEQSVGRALGAHLCRCTGWRPILEAAALAGAGAGHAHGADAGDRAGSGGAGRDLAAAAARAEMEGGAPQKVGLEAVLGGGGFADDTAPAGALVAVPDASGGWALSTTRAAARARAARAPGRNSTVAVRHPLELPEGDFALRLRTAFVEPAYLEPDASWCLPGDEAATPLANGGAFGAKRSSAAPAAARRLALEHGRPVRVVYSREDVVRLGPKRPPMAAGVRADGTGVIRVARTPGSGDLAPWRAAVKEVWGGFEVDELEVPGPPVSAEIRAAGWAEATVLRAAWGAWRQGRSGPGHPLTVRSPEGAAATVTAGADGTLAVTVEAGEVLDEVVLRSYVMGAVHQGLGWVLSEGLAVDEQGEVLDLTIRSFGVLPAREMPPVEVRIVDDGGPPRRCSDAVMAAVAAACWLARGLPPQWPCGRGPDAVAPPRRGPDAVAERGRGPDALAAPGAERGS
jgi:xanthine dehydrogenase small subunit